MLVWAMRPSFRCNAVVSPILRARGLHVETQPRPLFMVSTLGVPPAGRSPLAVTLPAPRKGQYAPVRDPRHGHVRTYAGTGRVGLAQGWG